jgi:hypothetical protein
VALKLTEAINCGLKRFDCAAIRARELREGAPEQAFPRQEVLGNLLEAAAIEALEVAKWREYTLRLSHHPQHVINGTHRFLSLPNAGVQRRAQPVRCNPLLAAD